MGVMGVMGVVGENNMDKQLMDRLLQARKKINKPFNVSVSGISMNPTLYQDDIVSIIPQDEYEIGDILVFNYKQGELLVHRLLDIKNDTYYCKGDNSFRLEDIKKEQIVGKVIGATRSGEDVVILQDNKQLIYLSKLVNRVFIKCRYDIDKTKQTAIYQLYNQLILNREGNTSMLYKKNENMDYISEDESSLVVFDPDSGDTHFLDEIGVDILNIIETPCTMESLLDGLCKRYNAQPADIKPDVEEFLQNLMNKKVVETV